MATFSEVKAILDGLVAGRDPQRLRNKHGGPQFGWETAEALRGAKARFPGEVYPLLDPTLVGNGRADETYIMRILSGPLEEEGFDRMPQDGPVYATAAELQTIRDWINEGALDDPV
ncbi:MAG TPA: hypothetical protein VLE43_01965 [Candidatus Saccharimonadia bacterium]|nr:hypothetical protein [Candidatus Saccharimonadia bacterium]